MAERFGSTHKVRGRSTQALMQGIAANHPDLKPYLCQSPVHYRLFVANREIFDPTIPIGSDRLIVLPVPAGSGKYGRTIGGAILIGIGVYFGGNPTLIRLGSALMISGISGFFSARPKTPDASEEEGSFLFDGLPGSSNDDSPIPLPYGEGIVEGVVLSQAVSTNDI